MASLSTAMPAKLVDIERTLSRRTCITRDYVHAVTWFSVGSSSSEL